MNVMGDLIFCSWCRWKL